MAPAEDRTPAEATSNGLADALVFVARHHGLRVSVTDIERRLPYDPRGLTAAALAEVALAIGLNARLVEIRLTSRKARPTPTRPSR